MATNLFSRQLKGPEKIEGALICSSSAANCAAPKYPSCSPEEHVSQLSTTEAPSQTPAQSCAPSKSEGSTQSSQSCSWIAHS